MSGACEKEVIWMDKCCVSSKEPFESVCRSNNDNKKIYMDEQGSYVLLVHFISSDGFEFFLELVDGASDNGRCQFIRAKVTAPFGL